MQDDLPPSPLDDIARRLRRIDYETHREYGQRSSMNEFVTNAAVTFPFRLYGEEFVVLATPQFSYQTHDHSGVRCWLYEADFDFDTEDEVFRTTYLTETAIRPGQLLEDDAPDDYAHLVATCLGYFTRWLLDGREYDHFRNPHEETPFEGSIRDRD